MTEDHYVRIVFKDGRKFTRKNMSRRKAISEYNRYLRDMLILSIQKVEWGVS
jgi:hypothetical protein